MFRCAGSLLLCGLSLVPVSTGCSLVVMLWASHCDGFSCCGAQTLGCVGSAAVAHRLSCPGACRIFLDQGSNPCLLHQQADSLPLSHQGSPQCIFFFKLTFVQIETSVWMSSYFNFISLLDVSSSTYRLIDFTCCTGTRI